MQRHIINRKRFVRYKEGAEMYNIPNWYLVMNSIARVFVLRKVLTFCMTKSIM